MSNWQSDSFLLLLCHKISVLHHFIFAIPVRDEKCQKISFTPTVCACTPLSPSHLQQPKFSPRSGKEESPEVTQFLWRGHSFCWHRHRAASPLGHRFLFYPLHCWQNEGYLNKPPKRVFHTQSTSASTYTRPGGFSDKGRRRQRARSCFSLLGAANGEKAAATVERIYLRSSEICFKDGNNFFKGPAWSTPSARGTCWCGFASMNLQSFIFPFHAVWDAALGFPCTYEGLSIVKILIIISKKIRSVKN